MTYTRRTLLETGVGTALVTALAGCTALTSDDESADGSDTEAESDPESDDTNSSANETPNASDDDSDGESDAEANGETDDETDDEPTEHTLELLGEEHIDHEHACLHAEFDDRTPLEAGSETEAAATVDETHVIWEVTYEGEAGYVTFDADAHHADGSFVFYTADGTATPVSGTLLEEGDVDDDECGPLDEYVEVEPEEGVITLELQAE
ncbi:hypothetical protein G6M89_11505 [Natronolimnobius sp. AArcel1]|uniref:hypothetical protein n=1 Tax=Natronolimnobius sp. AArcel1 TaxID=1679093 RepID=UPI0013EDEA4D|nr:hypothetical protein [Natronolimnobius sp. AArcel1]NGM69624.1 hypothetical protein [Natronolimnobius sp. AArcel1]